MAATQRKSTSETIRTLFICDSHYGMERVDGVTRPIHDRKAHEVMLQVAHDLKPDVVINGGDGLDCGAISHHNAGKNHSVEGFRLLKDAKAYRDEVLAPLEKLKASAYYYIKGNHDGAWLDDVIEKVPALEGMVTIDQLLDLDENGWDIIPQGATLTIGGKLHYLHGDSIRGGENFAKWAALNYGRSVLFGHFHSPQLFTRHNAIDATDIHQGRAIGCLCRRDPRYGKGSPNKWAQSFAVITEDAKGFFQIEEVNIIEGRAMWGGRIYRA